MQSHRTNQGRVRDVTGLVGDVGAQIEMPPLRVLLVESSKPDALRVVEMLGAGFEVEAQRLDTERPMLAAREGPRGL
jgi:hypothetical protein